MASPRFRPPRCCKTGGRGTDLAMLIRSSATFVASLVVVASVSAAETRA